MALVRARPEAPARPSSLLRGANPMLNGIALGEEDSLFSGWLLKSAPQADDTDKADSVGRRLRMAANSLFRRIRRHGDFSRRFFVLDGHDLRYYRDGAATEYAGRIDLGTVLEIRRASRDDVPPFALDLVRAPCPHILTNTIVRLRGLPGRARPSR